MRKTLTSLFAIIMSVALIFPLFAEQASALTADEREAVKEIMDNYTAAIKSANQNYANTVKTARDTYRTSVLNAKNTRDAAIVAANGNQTAIETARRIYRETVKSATDTYNTAERNARNTMIAAKKTALDTKISQLKALNLTAGLLLRDRVRDRLLIGPHPAPLLP